MPHPVGLDCDFGRGHDDAWQDRYIRLVLYIFNIFKIVFAPLITDYPTFYVFWWRLGPMRAGYEGSTLFTFVLLDYYKQNKSLLKSIMLKCFWVFWIFSAIPEDYFEV